MPQARYYAPSAGEHSALEENVLKLEELEAIRLKDLLGLEQEECAKRMRISRPTFQRILISAREKLADSLINGKAIRIEGGNYTRNICPVQCRRCGNAWAESFENMEAVQSGEYACPKCHSKEIVCGRGERGGFCRRHCRRRGHG